MLFRRSSRLSAALLPCATLAALASTLLAAPTARAQVSITTLDSAVTESFDGMGSSTAATLPQGFKIFNLAAGANQNDWNTGNSATTAAAGSTGTNPTAGGSYNWASGATASSTERALGYLTSSNANWQGTRSIAYAFKNDTGTTITALDITFDYEKYRSGTRAFGWTFFHGSDPAPATAATDGDHSYPTDVNNTTLLDPPDSVSKLVELTELSIEDGSTYYLRWTLTGVGGTSNAQGLGIDNFSITALGAGPVLPTLSIASTATVAENAGSLTIDVALSAAAAADVTFDIATSDGSATAGADYTATSMTPATIAAGSTSYQFIVPILDDALVEGDEDFSITVSNVSANATLAGAGSIVTIQDDDTPVIPVVSIVASASASEGDSGTTPIGFAVTIAPAPTSPVTLTATASIETGNTADANDLVLTSIPLEFTVGGPTTLNATFQIHGDTALEPDETFTVTLSGISANATLGGSISIGTILNDDILSIAAIQGNGALSPYVGAAVVTEGVVTAKASAGFWIQDDSCTTPITASCGVYVYGTASAALVSVGNTVRVSGTVVEFVPPADPASLPLTEISFPTVTVLGTGTLPAPVDLSAVEYLPIPGPTPGGALDQLERLEGMRVAIPDFTVTVPTNNGEYASTSSSGTFFGVVSGTPRPRREAGIDIHNTLPSGNTAANVPRWDFNSELIRVKSNFLTGGTVLDLRGGTRLENLVGVLDYSFRRFTLLPDPSAYPTVAFVPEGDGVTPPTPGEFTIATYNVYNLVYGTTTAYTRQSAKIASAVRQFLHLPDIIGLAEIGNQQTAADLAAKINADVVAHGGTDPGYVGLVLNVGPYNQEVGVLYKAGDVIPGTPRVALVDSTQIGTTATLLCPDNSNTGDTLMDRPPLVARFVVSAENGNSVPVTVIVNHLKALTGADSEAAPDPGFECFATDGARNRAKRQQGAELLASYIQSRQVADASERLVVIGDLNAYEFNDGLVDVVGTIIGLPAVNDETVQPNDGTALVNPPLLTLVSTVQPPDSAYSYIYGSNAQILDHIIVNQAAFEATAGLRLEYAHINADYRKAADANDASHALRNSDHDPGVAYFRIDGFGLPDAIFKDGFENTD